MEREAPISFWMPPVPFRSRFVSISFPVSFPFCSAKRRFYVEIAPKSKPTSSQHLLQIGPTSLQNRGLEVVWADLGAMVPSPCYFFLFLEASWGALGALGGVLGASWALLGTSWGRLGRSWGRLWGVLGASWGILGASQDRSRVKPLNFDSFLASKMVPGTSQTPQII